MSLGGLTAIALAAHDPGAVERLALVDVTPGVDRDKAAPIIEFVAGPDSFESFDEILERTVQFNPTRTVASLRRGVLHNAIPRDDGRWVWRHQHTNVRDPDQLDVPVDFTNLWDDLAGISVPVMLVRGGAPGTVVTDDDVTELRRRVPNARVEVVEGAGHSIQGDRPIELARLLDDFGTA